MDWYLSQFWIEKKKEGWTQEALAGKLDCSVGQVNKLISGKSGKWLRDWLPKLAEILDVPEWSLLFAKDELASDSEIREAVLTDDERDVLRLWHALEDQNLENEVTMHIDWLVSKKSKELNPEKTSYIHELVKSIEEESRD